MSNKLIFEALNEIVWHDQVAHAAAGYLIVTLCALLLPWWAALALSLIVAGAREMIQHPGACGRGCRTDLAFWFGGSVLGAVVAVL